MSTSSSPRFIFLFLTLASFLFFFYLAQKDSSPFAPTTVSPVTFRRIDDESNSAHEVHHLPPSPESVSSSSNFNLQHLIKTGRECYLDRWGGDVEGNARCFSSTPAQTFIANNNITKSQVQVQLLITDRDDGSTNFCLKITLSRRRRNVKRDRQHQSWTEDDETRKLGRALRLDRGWSEGLITIVSSPFKDGNAETVQGVKRFFLWNDGTDGDDVGTFSSCICDQELVASMIRTSETSMMTSDDDGACTPPASTNIGLKIMVFELFQDNDALIETGEDLPVQYFTPTSSAERTVVKVYDKTGKWLRRVLSNCGDNNSKNNNNDNNKVITRRELFPDWRVELSPDTTTNYEKDSRFGGYWLRFKGDRTRGNAYSDEHDLLGRMDFRAKYQFAGGSSTNSNSCALQQQAPPRCDKQRCFASSRVLGNKRAVVFIGDSHVRTLYYGMLERLGLPFAANRVWRGGHETEFATSSSRKSTRLKFVPSSFLDRKVVDETLAQVMASTSTKESESETIVVVAGLGQHHSTHCYTLKRHHKEVRETLEYFVSFNSNKINNKSNSNHNVNNVNNDKFKVKLIWFGIPAQPVNRHLFAPKPVGQNRKDCRNNARHLLYSTVQQSLCQTIDGMNNSNKIPFVDAFALSAGLSFTSIDGAHYYSFVRDAMLDSLGQELRKL